MHNGIADFVASLAQISAGTYVVTASYSGDNDNEPVKATQTITVTRAATTASLSGAGTIDAASSETYHVSVSRPNLPGVPTGEVTLLFASVSVGSAQLSGGVANITVPSSAVKAGSYQVFVKYAGDANNTPSNSQIITVIVK